MVDNQVYPMLIALVVHPHPIHCTSDGNMIARMFSGVKCGSVAEAGEKPALPHGLKPGGLRRAQFCEPGVVILVSATASLWPALRATRVRVRDSLSYE